MLPALETLSPARRATLLVVEGMLFTGAALVFASCLGVPQHGFFAIFLSAAGLTGRFDELLELNRRRIYSGSVTPSKANTMTAGGVLMMFIGVASAYAIAALWRGEARLESAFGFVLDAARIGGDTLFSRRFSAIGPTLAHNLIVLATFFALAFVYRTYGALLSLCWNACVWAMVLTILVERAARVSSAPTAAFIPAAIVAVLPHLLIEAASYVTGAMGGIYLSKAVVAYEPVAHRKSTTAR